MGRFLELARLNSVKNKQNKVITLVIYPSEKFWL